MNDKTSDWKQQDNKKAWQPIIRLIDLVDFEGSTTKTVIFHIPAKDQNEQNCKNEPLLGFNTASYAILISRCFRNHKVPAAVQYPVLNCQQMDWDQCI